MAELVLMTPSRRRGRRSFATHPMRPPDRQHRALPQGAPTGIAREVGLVENSRNFEHQNFARERQ
jgi:hypothetical protein